MKFKTILRVAAFLLIVVLFAMLLGEFFRPLWYYRTTDGFYAQPDNTVETVFVGASIVPAGIVPTQMYDEYGICAYNLGTAKQPILESYYWVEEAYRLHPETLKTVVLDVSSLRAFDESRLGLTIDKMRLSPVKVRAVLDYTEGDISDTLSALIPLVAHHDRWREMTDRDFLKSTYDTNEGLRGYYYEDKTLVDSKAIEELPVRSPVLDPEINLSKLNERSMSYFEKMAAFCKEHGIRLLLIKTPAFGWSSSLHNAVSQVAEQYEVDFLDYNFSPLYEEINYLYPFDHQDGTHLNYYGAQKLTSALGKYLVQQCGATDVRGKEGYEHMQEESREFSLRVRQMERLHRSADVAAYLEAALQEDNTLFLAVRGEAAAFLTEELRQQLKQMGLTKLATLATDDDYVAVIDQSGVIQEKLQKHNENNTDPLIAKGTLTDGTPYALSSGSAASCKLDHIEQLGNKKGINVLVYSNELHQQVDLEVFNTGKVASRDTYQNEFLEQYLSDPEKEYPPESILGKIRYYQSAVDLTRE